MNSDILSTFEKAKIDHSWSFEGADTGYITHNYHRYPAKFISTDKADSLAYPHEYILVMRKD